MGRKLIYLDDVIEALIEKGQASKRYSMSEEWELNYTEICDVIEDLPSAQPEHLVKDLVNDCISRQDAIEALEEQLDYLNMLNKDENPTAESKWYGVNWARNTIADLPSAQPERKKGEWIPCSERLPEEGNTTYMTTVDYGELGRGTGQRFFYGKNIGWEDDAVVAWMPLPEPYRGEE